MNQDENQPVEQKSSTETLINFDSDTPIERPAEGQACSLEPGCESCQ